MDIIPMLLKELEQEAQTTRKMLERIPADKFNWQPHVKSMTIQRLATHIAELPSWVKMAMTTDEINFAASDYKPTLIDTTGGLLELHGKSLAEAREHLASATEPELLKNWTMRNGDQVYFTMTKVELVRTTYCQIVHHRAQLGVYLRILDIPLPGSYGPTADESNF